MSPGPKNRTPEEIDLEKFRAGTGLTALVVTIAAVVILAIVMGRLLGGGVNSDSLVAIATAAFGIISTVATAYLGIRATANSSVEAAAASAGGSGGSDEAVIARYEEQVKKSKVDRLNKEIDVQERAGQLDPGVAKKLRDSSVEAEKSARQTQSQKRGRA